MEGYEIVTTEDEKVGHVVGELGDNIVFEHGHLRKHKRAVPRTFAHVDDTDQVVRVTVSRDILEDAPEVNGGGDERAIAAHYGLAPTTDAPTEGYGELRDDDPA